MASRKESERDGDEAVFWVRETYQLPTCIVSDREEVHRLSENEEAGCTVINHIP